MRCTQLMGLSEEAGEFLNENAARVPIEVCSHCKHETGGGRVYHVYDKETGREAGLFEDGPSLYEYTLKNGNKVREVVQTVQWASGPCIFLCLEDDKSKRIGEWLESEIEAA